MRACTWLCLLAPLVATPASAQRAASLALRAAPGNGEATLTLSVTGDTGLRPELIGFDCYRIDWGRRDETGICATDSPIRVTPSPLPRSAGTYSLQVVDSGLSDDRMYYYYALPVDASRASPVPLVTEAFDIRSNRAVVEFGRPLIAVARVHSEGHPPYWLELCPSFCSRWLGEVWSLLPNVVGDGKYYELYGEVRAGIWDADDTFTITEAVPVECQLAVKPSTWSNVKTLFR